MSYRLKRGEAPARAIPRVVGEQLDDAIAMLSRLPDPPGADRRELIHSARKRLKAVRGALWLVDAGMPGSARARARFRDIARVLAPLRDADAVVEAVDALTDRARSDARPKREAAALLAALADTRAVLAARQDASAAAADISSALPELVAAREEVDSWRIGGTGFDAVAPGLTRIYRRGRRRLAAARAEPVPDRLHRWRRAVKTHGFHVRLLIGVWPLEMKARRNAVDDLAEMLGDDHDLALLRRFVEAEAPIRSAMSTRRPSARPAPSRSRARIVAAIDARQAELRAAAFALGARVYAEKPAALRERLRRYHRAPPL